MYYQIYLSYQHGTEHRVLFKAVFVAWGKSACRSLSKASRGSPESESSAFSSCRFSPAGIGLGFKRKLPRLPRYKLTDFMTINKTYISCTHVRQCMSAVALTAYKPAATLWTITSGS